MTNLNHLQDALATRLATLIGTVVLAGTVSLAFAIALAVLNRKRDFTIGAGVIVFLSTFAGLMAIVFYAFPSIYLPGITTAQIIIDGKLVLDPNSNALDSKIGWRMWDRESTCMC